MMCTERCLSACVSCCVIFTSELEEKVMCSVVEEFYRRRGYRALREGMEKKDERKEEI